MPLNTIKEKQARQKLLIDKEDFRTQIPQPVPPRSAGSGINNSPLRLALTQEAAQADLFISVKLLDSGGTVMGEAFDATLIATDGATAANAALPRIATSKTILITKIGDTWYVVNPTIIKSTVCA